MTFLKISDVSETEYKYVFSVENIQIAKQLNKNRCEAVKSVDFISNKIKDKISELSKDFDLLADKIIFRDNIEDSESYDFTSQAITICNAKIADLLNFEEMNNEFYRKFIRKSKDEAKMINCFELINSKLGNSNYLEIKLNNWFTFIFIGFMILFFTILLIIAYINQNNFDMIIISIILSALLILITVKKEKLNKMIKHDYIQRIISKKEYSLSKTQKKYDLPVFETIKDVIENKL